MKNVYHLLLSLALLLWGSGAWAADAGGYTYDFDAAFGTLSNSEYTDHAAAPDGWMHLPDSLDRFGYGSYTYPTYTYSNSGRNGTHCLLVNNQDMTNGYGDENPLYDLMVTPSVSGTVTLWAKLNSSNGSVTFYQMEGSGRKLKRGTVISYTATLTKSDWTEITLSGLTATRIGIRVSNAYIDDFSATSATVAETPKLSLAATSLMGRYHDVADDGTYKLSWRVMLTNTGKIPVDATTPGYSISLVQGSDTLATFPQTATLQPGASLVSFLVEHVINYADYKDRANVPFTLVENITGSSHTDYITLTPARPLVGFFDKSYGRIKDGQTINFGSTKQKTAFTLTVANDGGKVANITAVAVPEGFRIDTIMPVSVAPHTRVALTIVKDSVVAGIKKGELKLGGDSTLTLNLVGSVIEPDVWLADLENGVPQGMAPGKWTTSNYPSYVSQLGSRSCMQSGTSASTLITPRLAFSKGDVLRFNAASSSTAGSYATTKESGDLTVYYSKDRRHWVALKHLEAGSASEDEKLSDITVGDYGSYYLSLPYEVKVPEGKWYIGFTGHDVYVDDIAGGKAELDSLDLFAENEDLPSKGSVNSPYTAKATFRNLGNNVQAETVTPVLIFGGHEVKAAPLSAVASGDAVTLSLTYTPHVAGKYPVAVALRMADRTFTTDTVIVDVAAESGESLLRVGTPSTSMWSGTTSLPVVGSYALSRSEIILPTSALNIAQGAQIKGFAFKGTAKSDVTVKTRVLIGTDSVAKFSYPYAFTPNEKWQTVFDDTVTIKAADENTTLLSFALDNPLVYDGNNLHLFFDNKLVGNGAKVEFERADESFPAILQQAYTGTDYASDDTPYTDNAPVVYLNVEQTPHVLSGMLTAKDSGLPVAGAKVSLVSGDVAYETTTATDGSYSLTVYKYDLPYTLNVEADGYLPVRVDGFALSADTTYNKALDVARGLYVENSSLPTTATVNHHYTATAVVRNVEKRILKAEDYTATLYVDGKAVASSDTKDVAAADTAHYTFAYTPHEAAKDLKAFIAFAVKADTTTTTDTVMVTIAPESASGIFQAGDSTDLSSSQRAPANFYYQSSEAEIIYDAKTLNLPAGAKISRMFFKGTSANTGTDYDATVRVYIANTTDPEFQPFDSYSVSRSDVADTTKMLKVYDGAYRVKHGIGSDEQPDVVLDLSFSEPFTYEGNNIRLFVVQNSGTNYMNVKYVTDSHHEAAAFMRYADSDLAGLATKDWYQRYLPVTYFEASVGTKVSGTVVRGKEPVAKAQVVLTNGDVAYTATTDSNGHYEVMVVQNMKSYRIVVNDGGLEVAADTIEVQGNEMTKDFDVVSTGIASVNGIFARGKVYDLNGRHVADLVEGKMNRALRRGVYVVNGKKIVIK